MDQFKQFFDWLSDKGLEALIIIGVTALLYWLGMTLLGSIVNRAVTASVRGKNWHRKDIEKRQRTLSSLFVNVWGVLIVTIGALVFLDQIFTNISLAPLFASAGIIGVALGFGAQSLVKDFISGVFIISENQYRVGDIIDINGSSGTVERIGTRSTVIRDDDGNVHYFPNGTIQHVINKTMGYSMARFTISVATSEDLENIITIINTTGKKLSEEAKWKNKILDPPVFTSVGEFTATNVSLVIAGKTQPSDQWAVISEMRRRLLEKFEADGISLSSTASDSADKK